jgi:hypothetical protein
MSVFERQEPVAEADDARQKKIDFWTLQHAETSDIMDNNVDELMSDMRSKKMYYWGEKLVDILFNGYIQTAKENSKFEIGHVNTFISGNALEGTRLKLGGNTTVNMSRHLFFDTRIAYGTLDKKLKYNILAEYSFNRKKMFRQEFPFHYLRAEYFYDINQIGQHYLYTNVDNLFLKFKRRKNNLITYMQRAELSYYHENYSGFAYGVALRRLREWATPEVPFNLVNADGSISPSGFYTSSQLEFKIRWSPAAKFFQSRNSRIPITADAPIFTLKHAVARKGILGTDHNYNQTEIGIRKRFHLSPFGFTDVYLQAGKVWDKVPYPLLLIPNANLSYTIQPETFTLMDPMEFINDRYVSWEMTYRMNGWLLNRTPLIKWLQLREVLSFRGWYGDLSDKNNAITQTKTGLFLFPKNTYLLGKKPYMEVGVGLENIFKILRLDYVWRLSYRNHEHVPNSGLRMRLQLAF